MVVAVESLAEDDSLVGALEKLLRNQMPKALDLRIWDLTRMSTGFSRENWTFLATWRDDEGKQRLPLILRRDPPGSLLETDRRHEHGVLTALYGSGIPVPHVRWADIDGEWLGAPSLIMDIVEGECDWHALTGSRPIEARLNLASAFLDLLCAIQRVDWQGAGLGILLGDPGANPALRELDHWEAELRRVQLEPLPEMVFILIWLRQRAKAARGKVLVHGDFKPGNALLVGNRINAMLDWETAHIGDPLEDLGWITNPARSGEHQIPGLWEREQIVEAFKERTGYDFDDQELLWWNIFSCWKLAVIILTGMSAFVNGRFDRVHHNPVWLYRRMFKMMEL